MAALSVFALSAASPPASVSAANQSLPGAGSSATGDALTGKQKAARNRALRKCKAKRTRPARQLCRKKVRRRFATKPVKPAETEPAAVIDVSDDFFNPGSVDIDLNESILWVWNEANHNPHDLTLVSHPKGIDRADFETGLSPSVEYTFHRRFTVPGTYRFVCSLHFQMKIDVAVHDE
ncbi:MAG: cupredoxin domain-containing protein [Solirubrobacterales bacterium]